jgi:hypothetical protein
MFRTTHEEAPPEYSPPEDDPFRLTASDVDDFTFETLNRQLPSESSFKRQGKLDEANKTACVSFTEKRAKTLYHGKHFQMLMMECSLIYGSLKAKFPSLNPSSLGEYSWVISLLEVMDSPIFTRLVSYHERLGYTDGSEIYDQSLAAINLALHSRPSLFHENSMEFEQLTQSWLKYLMSLSQRSKPELQEMYRQYNCAVYASQMNIEFIGVACDQLIRLCQTFGGVLSEFRDHSFSMLNKWQKRIIRYDRIKTAAQGALKDAKNLKYNLLEIHSKLKALNVQPILLPETEDLPPPYTPPIILSNTLPPADNLAQAANSVPPPYLPRAQAEQYELGVEMMRRGVHNLNIVQRVMQGDNDALAEAQWPNGCTPQ